MARGGNGPCDEADTEPRIAKFEEANSLAGRIMAGT